ncbi:MAG: hypothetical protein J5697_00610 [Clostridia bacterium]|nr:hypothetical protein [Clostridia bacterium]
MVFLNIGNFVDAYGTITCIFSAGIFIVTELVSLVFKNKPAFINYLPFFLGIATETVYLIISGEWTFWGTFGGGVICGSLSEILSAIFYRIKNGKKMCFNARLLLVEGIVKDFLPEERVKDVSERICAILKEANATEKIAEILNENMPDGKTDVFGLATLIIASTLSIGDE